MYADRYAKRRGLDPAGIAFAVGASGFLLFGLSLSAPNFTHRIETILTATNIKLPKDPPPRDPVKPQPATRQIRQVATKQADPIDLTRTVVAAPSSGFTGTPIDLPIPNSSVSGAGEVGPIPPVHNPVLLGPQLDPRYVDAFQPGYPSDERLAGHEGRVVVRVLIGTDGRVKEVQQVSAASGAFFEATRKQALAKWRFKPGTSDGVAVETWHTMAVRFVLDES